MRTLLISLGLLVLFAGTAQAQLIKQPARQPANQHRFWDRTNIGLFSMEAAVRAMDYHSTIRFRKYGINERVLTNRFVDDHRNLAAFSAGAVAFSTGVRYILHRQGRHRLERWVSIIHIGMMIPVVADNYHLGERSR